VSKLKLLYEDLKPEEKLGEVALEVLRRAPLASAKTVLAALFEAKFNLDEAMNILNNFLKIVLKSKFYGLDKVERAVGLGIDWEEVLKIKSLFPRRVENLWVYDVQIKDVRHYKMILNFLRGRFGDDPRKIVEQVIRKCDVFKIRDDLYVVCVLFLGAGWKIFVVKGGGLVRESKLGVIGDHMKWWDIWPYYLSFTGEFHELPRVGWGVLETWCRLPCDLLVVDRFNKGLVVERRDGRVLLCSMCHEAGWEAVEYARSIKDDKSVRRIFWWRAPEVWEWWYGLDEKPDLEEKYSRPFARERDSYKLNKVCSQYSFKFLETLVPRLKDAREIRDENRRIEGAVRAYLRAGWAPKVLGHGHLVIESDGFDAKHFLELYFRVDERKKWLDELDEISRKYMIKESLRKEGYIVFLDNKI